MQQPALGREPLPQGARPELADAPLHRDRVDPGVHVQGEGDVDQREDEGAVGQPVDLEEVLRHHRRDPGEALRCLLHLYAEQRDQPVAGHQPLDALAHFRSGHVHLPAAL